MFTGSCRTFFGLVLCCFVGSFALTGCGDSVAVYPVNGQVFVDGKPLEKGNLLFWPDSSKGNTFPKQPGASIENGRYRVMTDGRVGAPLGAYKVTIAPVEVLDSTKPMVGKSSLAAIYRDASKTPLKVDVVASPAPEAYDLKAVSK